MHNCWLHSSKFRNNPISPAQLLKILTLAIWHNTDPGLIQEAEVARRTAIRFLVAIKPIDLPQLQEVLTTLMVGPVMRQKDALAKLVEIYRDASKQNPILPPVSVAIKPTASRPAPKAQGAAPKPAAKPSSAPRPKSPPPKPAAMRDDYDESRSAPKAKEACRACDGRGYRTKVDKENVMKETKNTCSKCGGSGLEPKGPSKGGKGRGGRRGPFVEETEDEQDINKKTDGFLRRHGYGRWGQGD